MSVTINNSTTTGYNFKNNSNQLTSINKPFTTLAYDEIGNTVSDSNFKLQYDLRGRLAKITGAQGSFSYSYDNNGLRIRKSNGSAAGTKIFAYNTEGNILGEYDGSGNPIQEIIWLGNMPLAIFTPDSTTGANSAAAFPQLFYIHSDHLNTPRVVVDKFNVLRWRWISEPFGTTTAETSPAGQADLLFNLRFPGQYYDAESGMHQNWNRDYIPGLGRYAESDPIGLSGGNNTYSYVGANPISYTDKLGLATDEEIRKAVATLRCANRKEFEILAKSIIMANMGENGSGMTDWNNNITLNSGLYGDEKTPTDEFIRSEFLQTLAHELLHVNQGLGGKIITRIRMGNPLGVLHRQLDSKAEAMITSQLLDQYNKALQNGDSGCTCSR
ncbi:hypothetical protein C8236_08175 [Paracidovorax avenae]|nr:hypothetical protein C8236_08175 [Paracidovorax avenae]